MVVAIAIDDVVVPEALAAAGFLPAASMDDREAIARAIEQVLCVVTGNATNCSDLSTWPPNWRAIP